MYIMSLRKLLYICALTLCICDTVLSGWSYPPSNVNEGSGRNFPFVITTVHSSNPMVATYGLSGIGVDSADYDNVVQKFKIDPVSGDIEVTTALDRESKSKYILTVFAYDSSNNQVEKPTNVTVNVIDVNDCYPQFEKSSLTGSVPESNTASSPSFMTIKASDADDPETNNAAVRYSIVSGSDIPPSSSSRFSIDSETGKVSVIGGLDYETNPQVSFKVEARDGGEANAAFALRNTSTVTVNVQDSNDNAPTFSPDPSDKTLSELSSLDISLYDIYADDVDIGKNKKVYFEIISGNIGGTFKIVSLPSDSGKSKGELQLVKDLDFESGTTSYLLKIRAFNKEADNRDDNAFYAETDVNIKVSDENEPPEFIGTPYTGYLDEANSINPLEPEPVIRVSAEDYDFNGNQTVTYSIDDPQNWFRINTTTGQITQISRVDREASVVEKGVYNLKVMATDNYDHATPKSKIGVVSMVIADENDNPPSTVLSDSDLNARICEEPANNSVIVIEVADPDSSENGPPFTFLFDSKVNGDDWKFESTGSVMSRKIIALFSDYNLDGIQEIVKLPFTITDSGAPTQTGSATVTVTICKCSEEGEMNCSGAQAAAFPIAIIIAIIAVLLLIIILIFALVAYKRRQAAHVLKEPFFDDEDDVRENVQVYQEEGGEEDQDAYDLTALRAPLLEDPNQPVRIEKPLQQAPRQPRGVPDDIGDYIGDAKDQADADPSAPPFDSLLVFDYEGAGSDAGSLSSINTATTDGSMDYDYLNNWGPRFKKLSDMYNDGSDSE